MSELNTNTFVQLYIARLIEEILITLDILKMNVWQLSLEFYIH